MDKPSILDVSDSEDDDDYEPSKAIDRESSSDEVDDSSDVEDQPKSASNLIRSSAKPSNKSEDVSDSEDDDDYVPPKGVDNESSADEIDSGSDEEVERKSASNRRRSSAKDNDNECSEESKETKPAEEVKKRISEIYKSFLEDVKVPRKPDRLSAGESCTNSDPSVSPKKTENPKKITVTEEYEFAGETVKVSKEIDCDKVSAVNSGPSDTHSRTEIDKKPIPGQFKRPGGLTSIMGALDKKKQKISTLQKSLLDWNNYKKEAGIHEELENHNKGKDGYLEKQAFLQRTDLRQFDLERNVRISRRKP